MGNPRTNIADLRLQGSPNIGRALKRPPLKEARFEAGTPEMPSHLTAAERTVWARVVALLEARGTLTQADGFVIEKYCALYVRWRAEQTALNSEGTMIEKLTRVGRNDYGVYVSAPNPRLKIVQATEKQLLALDRELGLTPRHRGKPGETKTVLSLEDLLTFGSPQ